MNFILTCVVIFLIIMGINLKTNPIETKKEIRYVVKQCKSFINDVTKEEEK